MVESLTPCPGDPQGHVWVLHDKFYDWGYAHKVRRTFFRKRLVSGHPIYSSRPFLMAVNIQWYCSKCRTFEVEMAVKTTEDEILAQGYEIYGKMPTEDQVK